MNTTTQGATDAASNAISDRELQQIERANATNATPVVFIHGLWLLPSSWDPWAALFEEAGYVALTPDWPDDPETVEGARAEPEVLAKKTLGQVADHSTRIISALERKPAVIGHSTGGLLAEILAGQGALGSHRGDRPGSLPRRSATAAVGAQGRRPVPHQPAHPRQGSHAHVRPVQVQLGERVG